MSWFSPRPQPHPTQPGQESVWDYPRPPIIEPTPRRLQIVLGGQLIADCHRGLRVLETSHPPTYYLHPDDFVDGSLISVPGSSLCEWKGRAVYFDVVGGDRRVAQAAWAYPNPSPGSGMEPGYVAVYATDMDECRVDGLLVTPQPGGFYGGWITPDVVGPFKGGPGTRGW